jgi:hypothetical protein
MLSRRALIAIISAAVAVCCAVLTFEYAFNYINIHSNPHHWYAVDVYVHSGSPGTATAFGNGGVMALDARGPYRSRAECKKELSVASNIDQYGQWACREMTDKDASALESGSHN